MRIDINRRYFFGLAASGVAAGWSSPALGAGAADNKIVVGVMGVGGRGLGLAKVYAAQPGVTVAYVCDADANRTARAADEVGKVAGKPPQQVADFRRILDDKGVDALVCAACNHWHAPATILACAAGKHVYVEKPCSHNPREGELMVAAARKHDRRVQMGVQRRSWPAIIEAIEAVRSGAIGRAYAARSWYMNARPSIGKGSPAAVPAGLDYELWQGPAPRRPFHTNYLPYHWHWFWHWGNGELGNNGVHMLDVCRWGLGVGLPKRVASAGGRYRYADDQQTPDTHTVTFDFPGRKTITWEGLSCNRYPGGTPADVIFLGEKGSLAIRGPGYVVYDEKGTEVRKQTGAGTGWDSHHTPNFLAAVRGEAKLNSEIAEGATSTLLCHLGNMAHRVGRSLTCDPATGRTEDKEAMALWSREYAPGWEPKV